MIKEGREARKWAFIAVRNLSCVKMWGIFVSIWLTVLLTLKTCGFAKSPTLSPLDIGRKQGSGVPVLYCSQHYNLPAPHEPSGSLCLLYHWIEKGVNSPSCYQVLKTSSSLRTCTPRGLLSMGSIYGVSTQPSLPGEPCKQPRNFRLRRRII